MEKLNSMIKEIENGNESNYDLDDLMELAAQENETCRDCDHAHVDQCELFPEENRNDREITDFGNTCDFWKQQRFIDGDGYNYPRNHQ